MRNQWTESEYEILKANYQHKTCAEIGEILGRTTRSVQHQFKKLNLIRVSNKSNEVSVNQKINRYIILEKPFTVKVGKQQKVKWKVKCECECGIIKEVWLNSLLNNHTKSCGCYFSDQASNRMIKLNTKYTSKELTRHNLYRAWHKIKTKGELVEEWQNYENFYNWGLKNHSKKHKLVRIDQSLPFGPDNCIFKVVNTSSFEEEEIRQWLKNLGFEFNKNNTVLNGYEIDLYNEHLRLGIEYCGLYWHSEINNKTMYYHYKKYKQCLNSGVRLLTIFSDEWLYRQEQVKSFIKSILHVNKEKIYARKCSVKYITSETGKGFIEQYHIQGQKKKALVYIGLYNGDKLIGVMSFAKHHRNTKELVLDRLCFKNDILVLGGASKLFSLGVLWAKNNGYKQIISWSDNRWSQGKIYEILGFKLDKQLRPDYSYIEVNNPKTRKSKQSMKKSRIKCPIDKTENEYTKELGYSRIWDCGKQKWVYNIGV